MALDYLLNEAGEVEFSNLAGPPDIVYGGDIGLDFDGTTPTYSTRCKIGGKKVATQSILFAWVTDVPPPGVPCPHSSATYDFLGGAGSIPATAVFVKAENKPVMRENDAGVCAGSWKLKVSPFTVVPCACDLAVSDGGQGEAKGS